jgi:hypothetical protein
MYGELLFGNIAIQLRYATQEQIEQALQKQETKYQDLPLGEILILSEVLTANQRDKITEIQFEQEVDASKSKFGKLAMVNGFVDQKNLMKAVQYQKEYFKRKGKLPPLGHILLKQNIMTEQQVKAILTLQSRLQPQITPSQGKPKGKASASLEKEEETEQERLTEADFKIGEDERSCPHCRGIIYKDLTFCTHCKTFFCRVCSGELDPEKRFCLECGSFVQGQKPFEFKKIQRHSSTAQGFAYAGLAVGLLVGVLAIRSAFIKEPVKVRTLVERIGEADQLISNIEDFLSSKKFPEAKKEIQNLRTLLTSKKKSVNDATWETYEKEVDAVTSSLALAEDREKTAKTAEELKKEQLLSAGDLSFEEKFQKATNFYKRQNYPEAYELLLELLLKPEKTWQTDYLAGEVAIQLKRIDTAIQHFEAAERNGGKEIQPELQKIYKKLASLYEEAKDSKKLILLLEQFQKRTPEEDQLLAYSYWQEGQREKCWELLLKYPEQEALKSQVLLAECAMAQNKATLMPDILNRVKTKDVRFLDIPLWEKWYELCGNPVKYLHLVLKDGTEAQGQVLKETEKYYKLESRDENRKLRTYTYTLDRIQSLKEIPHPDKVELEAFLKERAEISWQDHQAFYALGKKHLHSFLLEPFALASLARAVNHSDDALELLIEKGYHYYRERGYLLNREFAHFEETIGNAQTVSSKSIVDSEVMLNKLAEKYPEDPYLLYFRAVIHLSKNPQLSLEFLKGIPSKSFENQDYLELQARMYFYRTCPVCRGGRERCNSCQGSGEVQEKCKQCEGAGFLVEKKGKDKKTYTECPKCKGIKQVIAVCTKCRGEKFFRICSHCGKPRDEPLPEIQAREPIWYICDPLAQFLLKGKIVLDHTLQPPKILY